MADIVEKLRVKAGMLLMGEPIAFGSDAKVMNEAADEIERMRVELSERCPVDAMDRGMSHVEAAVWNVWGDRCPDFEPECPCCRAWAEFDQNAKLRAENEFFKQVNHIVHEANYAQLAENAKLRAALDAWADACRVDVTMEGPCFRGIERSAAAKAWKATLDALEGK